MNFSKGIAVPDATRVALGSNRKPWKESRFSRPELHSLSSFQRQQAGLPANPGPQLHSPESFHRRMAKLGQREFVPGDQRVRAEMPLSPGDVIGAARNVARAVKALPEVQKKMLAKFGGKAGSKSPDMMKVRKGNSPDHDTDTGFILSNGKTVPHIGEHFQMTQAIAKPKEIAGQFKGGRKSLLDEFMETGAIRVDERPRQGSVQFEMSSPPSPQQLQQIAKAAKRYGVVGIDYKGNFHRFDTVGEMMRFFEGP